MTSKDDARLLGRHPEFARMSLKPGLGYGALHEVAKTLVGHDLDRRLVDVPSSLRHGAKMRPLGRYLTQNLRELVGHEKEAPPELLAEIEEAMRSVREDAFDRSISLSDAIVEANDGKRASMISRYNIYKQRKSI